MEIRNFKRHDDGSCDFEYYMTEEEASQIMQHGLHDLILKGFIKVDTEAAQLDLFEHKETGGTIS